MNSTYGTYGKTPGSDYDLGPMFTPTDQMGPSQPYYAIPADRRGWQSHPGIFATGAGSPIMPDSPRDAGRNWAGYGVLEADILRDYWRRLFPGFYNENEYGMPGSRTLINPVATGARGAGFPWSARAYVPSYSGMGAQIGGFSLIPLVGFGLLLWVGTRKKGKK